MGRFSRFVVSERTFQANVPSDVCTGILQTAAFLVGAAVFSVVIFSAAGMAFSHHRQNEPGFMVKHIRMLRYFSLFISQHQQNLLMHDAVSFIDVLYVLSAA